MGFRDVINYLKLCWKDGEYRAEELKEKGERKRNEKRKRKK